MIWEVTVQGFRVHSSRLKEFAPGLCAIALDVLQELDELCIWLRIEPVFHESNLEP